MFPILVILLLIVLNGLFAMAEMAVVSARKPRLQQLASEGSAGAQTALDLSSNPDRFLSTIQIGITLIGILAGAFGERTLGNQVAAPLRNFATIAPYSDAIAFGLVVVLITYLSLILGELVPKRLALQNPERIASIMASPMHVLSEIGGPAVTFLGGSTRLVLRVLRARPSEAPPVTEEEIKVMMEQGAEAGVFEPAEHEIVNRIFKLGDRAVSALMVPRRDVVWLDVEEPFSENQRRIASSLFSRFPVGQGSLDNVLGIVHAKDLLTKSLAGGSVDLKELLRPPLFVPEALPAFKLLEMFKKSRTHIALVVDEYGGVEGLVTLNDILEDLVGDVASADMPEEKQAVKRPDGSWLMDGKMLIDEVKETLNIDRLPEEESGGYQTLGGLVMLQVGRVPVTGDSFQTETHRFEVVDMDGKRVDKVLVVPLPTS
ncbi:MAG: HlyC/CorC family transporter [Acidobacteria bacterium]|nr:HlyC/CorC family transporter [Acidobacteriota bacterium]